MMKSFFKKLAFVMALAMIVTSAAPAANVFAAEAGVSIQGTTDILTETNVEVGKTVDLSFQGCTNWKEVKGDKSNWSWTSDDEAVATVDVVTGLVTGVADGEATITIKVAPAYEQSIKVIVGKGKVASNAFTATQKSDAIVELVFENTKITADEIKAGLSAYWYAGDYKVNQPFEVIEVKEGVAKVNVFSFTDGLVYGFTYGEEVVEFKATIGAVARIELVFAGDKVGGSQQYAYVNQEGFVTYKLFNAQDVDITNVGLPTGAYINYTVVNESLSGEYYITDPTGVAGSPEGKVMFTVAGKVAKIKGEYVTGKYDETTGAPIAGPTDEIDVVAVPKPAYALGSAEATISTQTLSSKVDWTNKNTTIAYEDEKAKAHRIVVKFVANDGTKVNSIDGMLNAAGQTAGTLSFKSNNNAVAYVDANGYIITNGTGAATVLVYFTPVASSTNPNPSAMLVTACTINVAAKRAAATVTIDSHNKSVSIEAGSEEFNKVEYKVTVKDQLQDEFAKEPKVERVGGTLPTGITAPTPSVEKVSGKTGQYKIKFTINAGDKVLPTDSTSYPYTYTVKAGDAPAQTIVLTVKSPIKSNGVTILSGQEIGLDGKTDLKTNDLPATTKSMTAKLYLLSNSVRVGVANLDKKLKDAPMYVDKYYYTVTKDGKDITKDFTTLVGQKVVIDFTKLETVSTATNAAVKPGHATYGLQVGNQVVKKNVVNYNSNGNYVITVIKGIGATANATTQAFTTVATKSFTVSDSQDSMYYAGKDNALPKVGGTTSGSLEEIVMNSFEFKLGKATLTKTKDYLDNGIKISVNANYPAGYLTTPGAVIFVKSVTFYVPTKAGSTAYNEYTVNVNDYVTMTK